MLTERQKKQQKEATYRWHKKIYDDALTVECTCGCGTKIKSKDKYGRDRKYVSGHNNRKYDDSTEHKRAWNHRNREQRYQYKKAYIRRRKILLIELKGGECRECGIRYNGKNASIFDFHHKNPKEKEFNLSTNKIANISIDKCFEEIKKCDLLCSNCHRLLHTGGW